MNLTLPILLITLIVLAACNSPETTRLRAGGPGADVGNRKGIIRMHEGARPFENTPRLIPVKHPPLEPASQADALSRG